MSFDKLDAETLRSRAGAAVDSRKVANNTYAHRIDADNIGIRLHATDVLTFSRDGAITLNTGGWYTVTTKERLNRFLPAPLAVYSAAGTWHLFSAGNRAARFFDGMRVRVLDGGRVDVLNADAENVDAVTADADTKRDVAAYCKGLTDEKWREVIDHAREHGTGGDCWLCLLGRDRRSDHLRAHVLERYYMVTLALAALKEAGYRDPSFVIGSASMVKKALRRYLLARLLIGPSGGRRASARTRRR